MLTKEKANYQVKLILGYLPKEEYEKIPKDIIDYIESNYEYDEEIKIDPNIPLEDQNIDEKAYKLLEKIIKTVEESENIEEPLETNAFNGDDYNVKMTSVTWEKILNDISAEKDKNQKAKELLDEYVSLAKEKDIQIKNLKKSNEELYEVIKKIPKFIRKIFIKEDITKLLQ